LVFEVVHDGPKATDEFASDGDHGDERGEWLGGRGRCFV
jgi:hypothetical protein